MDHSPDCRTLGPESREPTRTFGIGTLVQSDYAISSGIIIPPASAGEVIANRALAGHYKASNGLPSFTNVYSLAIDPLIPATLYAGTDKGVFKSTDADGHICTWTR